MPVAVVAEVQVGLHLAHHRLFLQLYYVLIHCILQDRRLKAVLCQPLQAGQVLQLL